MYNILTFLHGPGLLFNVGQTYRDAYCRLWYCFILGKGQETNIIIAVSQLYNKYNNVHYDDHCHGSKYIASNFIPLNIKHYKLIRKSSTSTT